MRFTSLTPEETGVEFANRLDLKNPMKRLYESGFVCGSVVVGDVDGDKQPDLLFTNGPGTNRLYRQIGNLKFEDVTQQAGIDGGPR